MGSEWSLEEGWLLSIAVEGDETERGLGMEEAIERNRLGIRTWEWKRHGGKHFSKEKVLQCFSAIVTLWLCSSLL